jgi:hypothetical protein
MNPTITKGTWAKDEQGRIGVATADDTYNTFGQPITDVFGNRIQAPSFHLVDPTTGDTTLMVSRTYDGLTRATRADIPTPRIAHLTGEDLTRLGY